MTREWHETALELYAKGYGPVAIARQVPVAETTVSGFLFRHAGSIPRGRGQSLAWHARALALAALGHGPSEIARRLGITKNMVSGFLHRQKIKFKCRANVVDEDEADDTEVIVMTMDRLNALNASMDKLLGEASSPKNFIRIQAKQRHHLQLEISSVAGGCAWDVLGWEIGLKRWASQHGRDIKEARGILIVTLDTLARHYGKLR
jgi:transposase-like protein